MAIRIFPGITVDVGYTLPDPIPWYLIGGIDSADCVFAYAPDEADDLADSYINLVNPGTYDAAPGDAPGWSAAGWDFDGVSQYLVTGAVPVSQQWTVLVLYDVDEFESQRRDIFGVTEGIGQMLGVHTASGSTFFESGGSLEAIGLPELTGVLGIVGDMAYVNDVEVSTIPAGSGTFVNGIEIGRGVVGGETWERGEGG